MSEARFSNPRERRRTEQHPLPLPPSSKRHEKLQHHSHGYIDTPAFWDSLSRVWLTKHALRELNRRNAKPLPHSSPRRAHRPVTRNFLAELKKRRKPTQSIGDFLYNCTPKILRDIRLFSRHGGPDLTDLRGHPEPGHSFQHTMSLRHSSRHFRVQKRDSRSRAHTTHTKTTATKVTKNSRPRDANYQQRLIDSGIYPLGHLLPNGRRPPLPPNWKEIKRRLAKRRSSISPSRFSKKRHRNFVREDEKAFNEDDVKDSIIPVMLKAAGAFRRAKKNILFMNIAPIAPHISQAKPDYYYGARPGQIHLSVRNDEQLSKHITPSKHTHLPVVPNFSLEAKGPHGTTAEALLQACHNGVVGARAVHSLNTYGQDQPIYNNDLYAISSFYLGGVLKMYGHSVAQPNGRGTQPEYCMHKLGGWEMTSNRDTFLKGVTVFKNAMDLTKEYRDVAIAHANEHATDREENIDDEESAEDKEGTEDEESTGDGENIEDEEL